MIHKFLSLFSLVALPCFATSFTFGESVDLKHEKELIELVLQHQAYCTQSIANHKIYLDPEKLFSTKEGLFLRVDESTLIRLPHLESDENGCFLVF